MSLESAGRLWKRLFQKSAAVLRSESPRHATALGETDGYFVPRLISCIIPVLDLRRPWTLNHGLAKARSLEHLLADLNHTRRSTVEVVVVFNRQESQLPEFIGTQSRIDKYCVNSTNVGVSRAWNMGAMLAEGEYLCFVNDDVEVDESALIKMREVLTADCTIGEVGPAGGRFVDGRGGRRVGQERMEDADEISGFLFMTKRTVFDAVGGFEIRFTPAGYEEIDFSFKVRRAGLRCCVIPGLSARHHHHNGASSTNRPIPFFSTETDRLSLHERNKRIFLEKWKQWGRHEPEPTVGTGDAGKDA
jgi:GT2 family glycosyltransferase